MHWKKSKLLLGLVLPAAGIWLSCAGRPAIRIGSTAALPAIPRVWEPEALASLQVPLASPRHSPTHIGSAYYYGIPVRPVYKSYPIYHPGKEPPGYFDWLRRQEPEIAFDASKPRREVEWIKAGELIFDSPVSYDGSTGEASSQFTPSFGAIVKMAQVRNPEWYEETGVPIAKDGTLPFARYVIRKKGAVEVGNLSCGMCHTRVLPDGTLIKGAQGNFPFDRAIAFNLRRASIEGGDREKRLKQVRLIRVFLFGAPWLRMDPQERLRQMSLDEIAAAHEAIPPGVNARHGTSLFYPAQIPDLIGVRHRRYLDHTGLVRHRNIADLMRYAALNQDADALACYGDFIPARVLGKLPDDSAKWTGGRYSDEELYALALFLYSLEPPPNPNKREAVALRGEQIFQQQGCVLCHTPPLYTNNKLTPADGFGIAPDHFEKYDILPISVGTDSALALRTRRGTGYYKVPSLKGVWYRGPLEHNGSVATLEDWLDPRRIRDDYVPTGFRGYGITTRAIKGHRFGLGLSSEDRKALLAFLRTL